MAGTIRHSALFIHALNICLGCLCAAIMGLTAYSVSAKDEFDNDIPSNTRSIGMSLLFWPGVGGIVDALLFAFVWNFRPYHAYYKACILFVSGFIFIRPFIVFIFTFAEWGRATKSDPDPNSGYVTIETWACDVSKRYDRLESAHRLCTNLRAARYLQVPVLVLSLVFLALVIKRCIFSKSTITDTAIHDTEDNEKQMGSA